MHLITGFGAPTILNAGDVIFFDLATGSVQFLRDDQPLYIVNAQGRIEERYTIDSFGLRMTDLVPYIELITISLGLRAERLPSNNPLAMCCQLLTSVYPDE